ncbi:MAG: HEPN domain-containing protein [Oscillospiraceae bacterium]|jgi:HEPN domain-containing protein|nr:HEPN domain-containing protein [Oscillospiraceae bacterium]
MDRVEAAKEWHRYAEMDLITAKHSLSLRPTPLEIIAYLCQQCAEKYLKSYLVYSEKDIIKTHDLRLLCELCSELCADFDGILKPCSVLVRYATDTRYPFMKLDLTDHHIKTAIEYAEDIKSFVLERIIEGDNA